LKKPIPLVLIRYDSTIVIGKGRNHFYNSKSIPVKRKHYTITIVIKPGPARRVDPVAGPVWV